MPCADFESNRICVVDDDPHLSEAIREILSSVGLEAISFDGGQAFLDQGPPPGAGCVLTDVRMPGISGIELLRRMRATGATLPVIVMTGHAEVDVAVTAFRNGAFDFLAKPFAAADLIEVVQRALEANVGARRIAADRASAETLLAALGKREREVAPLLLAGLSNKEIGRQLGISHRTAEHHRQSILAKTRVRSVVELAGLMAKLPREWR